MSDLAEVEPAAAPSDADLRRVAQLAEDLRRQELLVASMEERLKAARAVRQKLAEHDLPAAMVACGYAPGDKNVVVGGVTLELKDIFRCGQLAEPAEPDDFDGRPGLAWLDGNGHGDLARRVVTVTLGRDSEALAVELIELLRRHPRGNNLAISHRLFVPWNTLSSFAREQISQGADPPLALLGVTRVTVAKVIRRERE
jgi:hypothetical protein